MCDNPAKYRFTWPGKDEAVICEDHVKHLEGSANAIGLYIRIIPLSEEDLKLGLPCNQQTPQPGGSETNPSEGSGN